MRLPTILFALQAGTLAVTGCKTTPPASDVVVADVADAATDALMDATLDDATDTGPADTGVVAIACSRTNQHTAGTVIPTFDRPSAAVQIYRDSSGVQHIYGANDMDTVYGSGYAQAVDRLFQMEVMKYTAQGRAAEVFGSQKTDQDALIRRVNIARWGRETTERLLRESPETVRVIAAWVSGVNRRVAEINAGTVPRPPGFRASEFDFAPTAWTVDDAMAVGRLLLFQNANQIEYDTLATILKKYVPAVANAPLFQPLGTNFVLPLEERPRLPPGTMAATRPQPPMGEIPADFSTRWDHFRETLKVIRSGGSNNWAIAGSHTDNGRPIIAGDPHQPVQAPNVLWPHHMSSMSSTTGPNNTLDVIGFSFAGTPGVQLGHNRKIAWTATTTYPDYMDLFDVPADDISIQLGDRRIAYERCTETIMVRNAQPVMVVAEDVPNKGILLPNDMFPLPIASRGRRVMFAWTGFRATVEAQGFFMFDRAQNVTEFEAAVDKMETAAFNFISADAQNISYRVHVALPDRGLPSTFPTPNTIVDGTRANLVWNDALLPVEKFPHSRGGTQGYLASSNNDPFGFTANGQTADDPWYYGVWFDPGTRARRIDSEIQRLKTAGNVTRAQMKTLQMDTYNTLADDFLPLLFQAVQQIDTAPALTEFRGNADLQALASQLMAWNKRMDAASSAAVVFEAYQHFLAKRVLGDDFGPTFEAIINSEPVAIIKSVVHIVKEQIPNATMYMQEGRDVLLLRALVDTRDWLQTRFGGTDATRYRWDAYHNTRVSTLVSPAGVFAINNLQTNGAVGTVNVSNGHFFNGDLQPNMFNTASSGAVYRMVMGFAADGTPEAEVVFPMGASGDPTSPYWSNGNQDWIAGTYHPLVFDRATIMSSAVETVTLNP